MIRQSTSFVHLIGPDGVDDYHLEIRSNKGYNGVVGVGNLESKDTRYILVIHYKHVRRRLYAEPPSADRSAGCPKVNARALENPQLD